MSDPKDRDPRSKAPPAPADGKRSGRAGGDERGNRCGSGSWRPASTAATSARRSCASSTSATCRSPKPRPIHARPASATPPGQKKLPGGGFNPYDNSSRAGDAGGNPYDNARNFGRKMQSPPAGAPAARKPMDLKRLDEWMQIKKRLQQEKKDDED